MRKKKDCCSIQRMDALRRLFRGVDYLFVNLLDPKVENNVRCKAKYKKDDDQALLDDFNRVSQDICDSVKKYSFEKE